MNIPAEVTDLKLAHQVQKGQEDKSRVGREGLRDRYDQNTFMNVYNSQRTKFKKKTLKFSFFFA